MLLHDDVIYKILQWLPVISLLRFKNVCRSWRVKPRKIKMLLHDDVIYQILQWLPVISLLRFKNVCRSWRALIESNYFIRRHLHLHHYDPSLKDMNQHLIYKRRGKYSPITFPLTSIEGFEEPNVCLQLNCSDLHGCFPVKVLNIVSFNGIICLSLFNCKEEYCICLWNPATKQSRVLPQSHFHDRRKISIGFGYDIKSNDYKVVKLNTYRKAAEMRLDEVYSLNTGCWRRLANGLSVFHVFSNTRTPFNSGTCFFWMCSSNSNNEDILCFDFCSEMFRCLPLPSAACDGWTGVVNDKIACVVRSNNQTEMWVLNEYGTVNESWTKLYTIDIYFFGRLCPFRGVSMNGNYIFFKTLERVSMDDDDCLLTTLERMWKFNLVTKETNSFSLENMPSSLKTLVGFKESLVSVGKGN